ncbi:FadD3 family acyl-CoA ligase [Shewanella corallii]|uniref:FadD3 family acyl-CoA ligase n=1 Tax=Shewanella corallii TaxID=560080 RepID=A0ABT0N7X2_9GAMM|nr:FadD3 family acyl-CoA ligase [Shewanella corallii]MCL2913966.1 FadD3 family acyl-CoA ligase [Shewanella corallii]
MSDLSTNPIKTIPALVFDAARRYGDLPAIEDGSESVSYDQLPAECLSVCRALIASGIEKGDRVAVWAPNCSRWVIAAIGLQMAGAVLVPLNTRMKPAEAADVLSRSGAKLLLSVGDFLDKDYPASLNPVWPESLQSIVVMSNRQAPACDRIIGWDNFIANGADIAGLVAINRAASVTGDDLSDLMFTSGTTGKPKGVMSRHSACLQAFSEFVTILGLKAGDRYLVVNPFFHAFGYKAGWLACLLAGCTILPEQVFDAKKVLKRIESDRVSVLPGPPTLYLSLLADPELGNTDLSSLRVASTGASSIPPVLISRMRAELGFEVVTTAYGLTECGGLATICNPQDSAEIIAGTSGKAIPGTEVSILDKQGTILPAGETGEICIRGFNVMQGYFDNPKATVETIDSDGWLHTGDLGELDSAGNLKITGRLKDMFIVGGFNCYPAEIEAQLAEHPAIAQSAVIGVPDDRMGEVGCACLVLRPGHAIDEVSMIQWCRERMSNYKVPRYVRVLDAMPVNASNKVIKQDLVHMFNQSKQSQAEPA